MARGAEIAARMGIQRTFCEPVAALAPGRIPDLTMSETVYEKIFAERDPAVRARLMAADWDALMPDACARDARGEKCNLRTPYATQRPQGMMRFLAPPVAANTYSATLVTAFLADTATTVLQKKFAPLNAFSRQFSTDPYKPRATGQLKKVTGGSTTQTNATDFESGNSVVTNVECSVSQFSQCFHVGNDDLNSGLRMQDLVDVNASKFGEKIVQTVTAPITEANFANYNSGSYVAAPAAFGWGDMSLIWGALKKANFRHAVLDGEYIGQLNNLPTHFQNAGVAGSTAVNFGWDGIHLNTEWTGAGAGVRGFCCDPQAIGVISGLPLTPATVGVPTGTLSQATFVIPGLGLNVAFNMWFSLAGRALWASYDVMLGAKELDTTAGVIIKGS